MTVAAAVDVQALWHTIWTATASALLVCLVVGVAVRSSARSHDLRLEGDHSRAVAHTALSVVFVALALGIAAYGLWLIAR